MLPVLTSSRIEHTFYEVLDDSADQLWLDSFFMLLVLALRDDVFTDMHTFQQVLDRRLPEGRSCETIQQRPGVELLTVFRQCTENGIARSVQSSSNYGTQFRELGHRAGIPVNIKTYDFRREMLILIEGSSSSSERCLWSRSSNSL